MMEFIQAGGTPMLVVIGLGLITLIAAGYYAWRPSEARLGFARGMSTATVYAILGGVASCFAAADGSSHEQSTGVTVSATTSDARMLTM